MKLRPLHGALLIGALIWAIGCQCDKTLEQAVTPDEWFLFFPTVYPDGNWHPESLDYEDLWFKSKDGTKLHAWYFAHKNPQAVILYAHGNGGHLADRGFLMDTLRERLQASVMIFDYRGYGRSEGATTVEGILQDARAARSKLAEQAGVVETEIILMGRSLGGAVAIDLTRDVTPRALVLESTFSSFKDIATEVYPKLSWLVPKDKLNSLSILAEYSGPLFQSHGRRDRTIPFAMGEKLFEVALGKKQFLPIDGADHNSPQGAEYYLALRRFLNVEM